jgi:hypothetical protein
MDGSCTADTWQRSMTSCLSCCSPLHTRREAIKRGDILFVASSGNNGTSPTLLADGELSTDVNPGNYPGSYPEVIAVSAVDCANNLAPFSQKNPSVDLAAPGLHILSTASRNDVLPGTMASGFSSVQPRIRVQSAGPRASQLGSSGTGKFTGKVADCGTGSVPCPEARDSICMVQYDPQIKQSNPSQPPAAAAGRPAAGSAPRGRGAVGALATRLLGGSQSLAQQQQQQPARRSTRGELPKPTKFFCDSMEYCMRQGARGMLIANPSIQSGFYNVPFALLNAEERTSVTSRIQESPVFATFDCSSAKCPCWNRVKNTARLPAAGLSLSLYGEVRAAVAAAKRDRRQFVGTVESKVSAGVESNGMFHVPCYGLATLYVYVSTAAVCATAAVEGARCISKGVRVSCHMCDVTLKQRSTCHTSLHFVYCDDLVARWRRSSCVSS